MSFFIFTKHFYFIMKHISFFIIAILIGKTTVYSQNIKVIDYFFSECDDSHNQCIVQPRIIYEIYENNTLEVSFNIVANCEGLYGLKAENIHDSLYLSYRTGSIPDTTFIGNDTIVDFSFAWCDCCFELNVKFKVLNNKPKYYVINGKEMHLFEDKYKIFPVEFDVIEGDTVNYKDKYGRGQGKWFYNNKSLKKGYMILKDDIFLEFYDENGKIERDTTN